MKQGATSQSDPLACALSYYVLYSEIPVVPVPVAAAAATTGTIEAWVEDHWTVEDEAQAAALLEANVSRCRVVQSPTGTHTRSRSTAAITAAATATASTSSSAATGSATKKNTTAWNRFYSNHTTHFFKDRHYLSVAFPHEFGEIDTIDAAKAGHITNVTNDRTSKQYRPSQKQEQHRCLLEIGCGVGNTMLPLLEYNREDAKQTDSEQNVALKWTVHGIDFSEVAVALIHQDERFQHAHARGRATAQVFDITSGTLPLQLRNVATVTSLLFCLSAIDPVHHSVAVRNAASSLRGLPPPRENGTSSSSGSNSDGCGVVIFRDYGRFDAAHLKLGTQRGKLLSTSTSTSTSSSITNDTSDTTRINPHASWYRKHDGTQCYYFTVHEVVALFEAAGMETVECDYIKRVYQNRSTGTARRRIWVQGRFRLCHPSSVIVEQPHCSDTSPVAMHY